MEGLAAILISPPMFTVCSHDQMFARKQAQAQGGDPGEAPLIFGSHDDQVILRYS